MAPDLTEFTLWWGRKIILNKQTPSSLQSVGEHERAEHDQNTEDACGNRGRGRWLLRKMGLPALAGTLDLRSEVAGTLNLRSEDEGDAAPAQQEAASWGEGCVGTPEGRGRRAAFHFFSPCPPITLTLRREPSRVPVR